MSPEAQQIAIAEAIGITGVHCVTGRGPVYVALEKGQLVECRVPNFPSDLNAMHKVEDFLNSNQWETWWQHMGRILPDDFKRGGHISAAQRAEAFLRTIGKWEESA